MTRPPLPFARPSIDQNDIDAVVSVLESGWLTQGPVTRAFEEEFAAAVGAKHAIAVCITYDDLRCQLLDLLI